MGTWHTNSTVEAQRWKSECHTLNATENAGVIRTMHQHFGVSSTFKLRRKFMQRTEMAFAIHAIFILYNFHCFRIRWEKNFNATFKISDTHRFLIRSCIWYSSLPLHLIRASCFWRREFFLASRSNWITRKFVLPGVQIVTERSDDLPLGSTILWTESLSFWKALLQVFAVRLILLERLFMSCARYKWISINLRFFWTPFSFSSVYCFWTIYQWCINK